MARGYPSDIDAETSDTVAAMLRSGIPKRLVPALLGAAALLALAGGAPTSASAASCPSFRVLHNDRIGAASFPAGSYSVSASTVSFAAASKLLPRFLEDY